MAWKSARSAAERLGDGNQPVELVVGVLGARRRGLAGAGMVGVPDPLEVAFAVIVVLGDALRRRAGTGGQFVEVAAGSILLGDGGFGHPGAAVPARAQDGKLVEAQDSVWPTGLSPQSAAVVFTTSTGVELIPRGSAHQSR
jgi:hypothetical protein